MNAHELWGFLFRLYVVLLGLLAISYPFQQPGSRARVITLVSAALIIVILAVLVVPIRWKWEPF